MSLTDHFLLALASLRINLRRAALALIGITVGVAALVGLISLANLTKLEVGESMGALGHALILKARLVHMYGKGLYTHYLTPQAARDLSQEIPGVIAASAEGFTPLVRVDNGVRSMRCQAYGVEAVYPVVMGLEVAQGRFVTQRDISNASLVFVLGADLAAELFEEGQDPVGAKITLNEIHGQVIGVLKPSVWEPGNTGVMLPLTTALHRLADPQAAFVNNIRIRAGTLDGIDQVKEAALRFFNQRAGYWDEVEVLDNRRALEQIKNTITTLKVFCSAVGFLTLTLGGIGLMNTILASLAERTREIGLRRAVGASQSDIFWQFLIEASALSLTGAVAGVALGWVMVQVVGRVMQVDPIFLVVDPFLALMVVLATVVVGAGFSFSPVLKAARLDLVQALRYY